MTGVHYFPEPGRLGENTGAGMGYKELRIKK